MKKPESAEAEKPKTVRGKYIHLLEQGSNIAVLDRDVVDHFPDSASVNRALRTYLLMKEQFAFAENASQHAQGRETPLPFDPRKGRRTEPVAATK